MKKSILKEYAKLIVKVGANVQKGQDVIIQASVEEAYFVPYVVEAAYKAKAKYVSVDWSSTELTKLNSKYASTKPLSHLPDWKVEKMEYIAQTLPAHIYLVSDDPDGLAGIDQKKMLDVQQAIGPIRMKYRERMDNRYQWVIAGIPGEKWAKKIFPDCSSKKAVELLWDAILKVTRAYGNSVENWHKHNENLAAKATLLNDLRIKKLTYRSANGTDFTVELKESALFCAGGAYTLNGVYYNPNMPTEECFTSPDKYSANGVVMATKPLSVRGVLVDHFGFRFEQGKITEVLCENAEHKEVLEHLIATDEGAKMLGEVALVPFDSPVNQTGLLFYNTLYDENACCHLAIGRAFNECIRGYEQMSEEEIKKEDLNTSMIHVDFMIGSSDLSIVATTYDQKEVTIFKDGTWAI